MNANSVRCIVCQIGIFLGFLIFTFVFFHRYAVGDGWTFLWGGDNSVQYYAWMHKLVVAWRRMTPPLWDFRSYSGISFVGELQTGVFYPLNILFAWFVGTPTQQALDCFLIFHFAIAAYGMWAFLRRNLLPATSSLAGALVFAFTGPMIARVSAQANIFVGLVYLPYVLLFYQIAWEKITAPWQTPAAYLSGIFLGSMLLAGHPQPAIHGTILLAVYAVYLWSQKKELSSFERTEKAALLLCFVAMAALAVAAIQYLPSREYFSHAYRWVGLNKPVNGLQTVPYAAYELAILQWKNFASIWNAGLAGFDGATLFLTLIGTSLALVGIFSGNSLVRFALPVALGALLVALGNNTIIGRLSYYLPLINKVREPARILILYQFAMALLAALGVKLVLRRMNWRWLRRIVAILLVCGIAIEAYAALKYVGQPSLSPQSANVYYKPDPITDYLQGLNQSERGLYRVVLRPNEVLPPNLGDVFSVSTLLGHRSSIPETYFDFLSRNWSLDSRNYDILGIKYVVSDQQLPQFPLLLAGQGFYLYERPKALSIFQIEDKNGVRIAAPVLYDHWRENSVELVLDSTIGGELIFMQPVYPGWQAEVNGQSVPISKNDIFMSIHIPIGRSDVIFRYAPWWFPFGLLLWVVVFAGLIISSWNGNHG
jgi:Bacterial membrane protein YfhO